MHNRKFFSRISIITRDFDLKNNNLNICTIQAGFARGRLQDNFNTLRALISQASAEQKPDLIILPENFVMTGSGPKRTTDPRPYLEFLTDLAAENNAFLIGGSFHRLDKPSGHTYNSCFIFDRSGKIIGEYRKRKLFDREIHDGVTPGEKITVFDLDGWKIGVLICADLWYPELCRELAGQIDILGVPAQSVVRNPAYQAYGRKLWHALALTRSQENSLVVAVADHAVGENTPLACGGASLCDPSASLSENTINLIQIYLENGASGFINAAVDKNSLDTFRKYRQQRGLLPNDKVEI
ncbi:MAG: carbon-nitrogen hydrolase family protein [FCB group bacterium]|nr:carbon-nitrogen hydrolase family protein [FCB group bacterium]